jgi:hypothetical protein
MLPSSLPRPREENGCPQLLAEAIPLGRSAARERVGRGAAWRGDANVWLWRLRGDWRRGGMDDVYVHVHVYVYVWLVYRVDTSALVL